MKIMTRRTIIGIIFIVAALLRLADMWGVVHLNWEHSWTEYFGPVLLLYVGIELVIYSFRHNPSQWLQRPLPQGEDGKRIRCSVRFGADEYIYRGERFSGARLDAFCGGIRLDLREAHINEDEEIDIHTFMGGVELLVPDRVNVVVKSHSFIGGVGNEVGGRVIPDAPYLHIVASNFLGGVNIKHSENNN
jgi:predicted membrane protein